MHRSWTSACGIVLNQENTRASANSQKLVGKARHHLGLDVGNQDNPVLLWMREHLWMMFHITQVPDKAALESHLHLERSSSTGRPVALQRSTVSGLWQLHGKKRLKVLPQLSEAEKPDQIKKGKVTSVERNICIYIFPLCMMQTFIIWTFSLFQKTRSLCSLKTKGKTNQRVSGSRREIQRAACSVASVWKAEDDQTSKHPEQPKHLHCTSVCEQKCPLCLYHTPPILVTAGHEKIMILFQVPNSCTFCFRILLFHRQSRRKCRGLGIPLSRLSKYTFKSSECRWELLVNMLGI